MQKKMCRTLYSELVIVAIVGIYNDYLSASLQLCHYSWIHSVKCLRNNASYDLIANEQPENEGEGLSI